MAAAVLCLLPAWECGLPTTTNTASAKCPANSSSIGINCSDGTVPDQWAALNMAVHLTMTQTLLDQTKQVIVVVRSKPTDGSDVCADLLTPDFSKTTQGAGIVKKSGNGFETSTIITPKADGEYGVLAYAINYQTDLLCESDAWCEESTAGKTCGTMIGSVKMCASAAQNKPVAAGCVKATVTHGQANSASVIMAAVP